MSRPENYQLGLNRNLSANLACDVCSIGSLGKVEKEEPVSNIHVNNCTLVGTTNGIRIKTWRGSSELKVSDLTFENIIMDRVSFPIIIDQHYCPSKDCADKVINLLVALPVNSSFLFFC